MFRIGGFIRVFRVGIIDYYSARRRRILDMIPRVSSRRSIFISEAATFLALDASHGGMSFARRWVVPREVASTITRPSLSDPCAN